MKQFLFVLLCSVFFGCNAQTQNNNAVSNTPISKVDMIQFFKAIEYTTVPYCDYIKEVKQTDEHTAVYEFDFSKVDSDTFMERFGASFELSTVSNKFTVIDSKIVYAEYEIVVGRTATEGVLTNFADEITIKEVSSGALLSSATTYKNGKKVSEAEFQDDDQKARTDFLPKMDFSNIKLPSSNQTNKPNDRKCGEMKYNLKILADNVKYVLNLILQMMSMLLIKLVKANPW